MAIRIDSALNAIPHQMMDEFNHETARGGRGPFSDIILPLNAALLDRAERLKAKDAEIERLRVQLAGCGVAAMQNTEESRKQRASKGDYGWSESYADVCRAVDEQIELRKQKDGAYLERNRCVALIASMAIALGMKAGKARTAIEGWSEDWHGCIYIDLPAGQVSWHYHDSQAHLFDFLPAYEGEWDGHDTEEKYRRVGIPIEQADDPVGVMTVDKEARTYTLKQYEAFADLLSGQHEIYTRAQAMTEAQIVAGARVLNKRVADQCGQNEADSWLVYGNDYIEDFRAATEAALKVRK